MARDRELTVNFALADGTRVQVRVERLLTSAEWASMLRHLSTVRELTVDGQPVVLPAGTPLTPRRK